MADLKINVFIDFAEVSLQVADLKISVFMDFAEVSAHVAALKISCPALETHAPPLKLFPHLCLKLVRPTSALIPCRWNSCPALGTDAPPLKLMLCS